MALSLFQLAAQRNLGVFLCKFAHLGLFFSLILYFIFRLNFPFRACFSNCLACFCKITWHHWLMAVKSILFMFRSLGPYRLS